MGSVEGDPQQCIQPVPAVQWRGLQWYGAGEGGTRVEGDA